MKRLSLSNCLRYYTLSNEQAYRSTVDQLRESKSLMKFPLNMYAYVFD